MRETVRGEITGTEPVTVAEAKLQARIDTTADDALITALITAARAAAEQFTRRALVAGEMTYYVRGSDLPHYRDPLPLPWVPVTAITTLMYVSRSVGTVITIDENDYTLNTYDDFAFVAPKPGVFWPLDAEEIGVVYDCGYAANLCPADVRQAILLTVAEGYAQREDLEQNTLAKASRALLTPWRVRWFE